MLFYILHFVVSKIKKTEHKPLSFTQNKCDILEPCQMIRKYTSTNGNIQTNSNIAQYFHAAIPFFHKIIEETGMLNQIEESKIIYFENPILL